jgi:hypothetical protein
MTREHLDYALAGTLVGGAIAFPSITLVNEYLAFTAGVLGVVLVVIRIYKAVWGQDG